MRRSVLVVLSVIALALGTSTVAFADPEGVQGGGVTPPDLLALISDDDVFSTADLSLLFAPTTPLATSSSRTQHYGPYDSESPDSGTCGNDWANEQFNRSFTVRPQKDGTYVVIVQFKQGTFETVFGPSPGACDETDGTPPGEVNAGIVGSMHGYFIIPLPAGTVQTSTDPHCDAVGMSDASCFTTTFINTHFTPCYPVSCPVTTYFFHYAAGDQGLVVHEWKNASCDRGGNHGDIASVNVGITPPSVNPPQCP